MIYLTKQLAARIAELQKGLKHSQIQFNLTESEFRLFNEISKCDCENVCFSKSLQQYGIGYRLDNDKLITYSDIHKKSYKATLDLAILLDCLPQNAYRSWMKEIKKF